MKRTIVLLITFAFSSMATGQLRISPPPNKPPTKKQLREEERNHNCIYKRKYNVEQRLQFNPFNKAATIILVSYDVKPDTGHGLDVKFTNEFPRKQGIIDFGQLDEVKPLSGLQVDSLTDLLYNFG